MKVIQAIRFLDRCVVVLCVVAMYGSMGSFMLEQLTFQEFIQTVIIELVIGLCFGLVGLQGIVLTTLHIADEIIGTKKARRRNNRNRVRKESE